jgi:hypothetical protein
VDGFEALGGVTILQQKKMKKKLAIGDKLMLYESAVEKKNFFD